MKDINECLEYLNNMHLPPHIAESIILRNTNTKVNQRIPLLRFVSGAQIHKNNKFRNSINYPGQLGDCGIYLITNSGKVLSMSSFDIDSELDRFNVVQIQGTKSDNLNNIGKYILRVLPWEKSLLDIIENSAKWCETKEIWVTSCTRIKNVDNGYLNNKRLALRYDVPAIERGFYPAKIMGWYKKIIE